ncbi:hypothetical protein [Arthrobacter wenxiniae]|uniref:Uncharacterized protein n=1 Tax=Arthrobacter wenxiniae TaxID=2713570 RepID=A0A7Y7IIJ8_9MICC|nr:hypothetical protein [Arthrobacter wenxiniae]NVM96111.1 hypothetical protein [Arthrobacter wenxiniae]
MLLDIPAGYSFTVRAASHREGDPVHQLSSFAKARSVSIGSGAKGGRIRAIEPGTEQGGEVLIHPATFISSYESMAA